MLNFAFHQVYIVVLIICSCNIMKPVESLVADLSLKICNANKLSKLPRVVKSINILPIKQNVNKKTLKVSSNETDNPNSEQKLMVQSFIKSSNNLFESETDALGEQSNGFYNVESSDIKSRLQRNPTENSAIVKTKLGECKSERYNRIKRFGPYYKTGTMDHVRNRQWGRRCDRARLVSKVDLSKNRMNHRRHTECIHAHRRLKEPNRRWSRRFSKNRRSIRKRRYTNNKSGPLENSKKYSNPGRIPHDTIEKLLMTMSKTDNWKNRIKWLMKRQDANDECTNPKKRIHCKKRLTTVVRKSINEGKTGKIQFPSTHRCIAKGTCPCSVSYAKCAPRTTCPSIPTVCHPGTLGRCLGVDKTWPTGMGDDICPVRTTTELSMSSCRVRRSYQKRCFCECGCGCPSNLQRPHSDRFFVRGSCGCGCGCGCSHIGGGQCGIDGTRRPNN